jgi:hypothetical protein
MLVWIYVRELTAVHRIRRFDALVPELVALSENVTSPYVI